MLHLRERLAAGGTMIGTMLSEIYVPNIMRILKNYHFDFVIIDCEHGYFDNTQIANLTAVAQGINLPVIVRTATTSRESITRLLDIGIDGILLSSTESIEEAKQLVKLCRYSPEGERSVSTFRAHTGYQNNDIRSLMDRANERILVIVQIESVDSVSIAKEILCIAGVDGALIGPNDMSLRMGIFGQYNHPKMQQAYKHLVDAANQTGKWAGIITNNEQLLFQGKGLGMRCFSVGSELGMLSEGAKKIEQKFACLKEKKA